MLGGAAVPRITQRYATPQMKPPSQVGNGENYLCLGVSLLATAVLFLAIAAIFAIQAAILQSELNNARAAFADAVAKVTAACPPIARRLAFSVSPSPSNWMNERISSASSVAERR